MMITSLQEEHLMFKRPPVVIFFLNYQFIWAKFTGENITGMYALEGSLPGVLAEARGMVQSVLNSLIVATSTTLLCLALGLMASYSFARVPMRASSKLLFYVFFSRLLPPISVLIPVYVVFRTIGLLDSLLAIILVHSSFAMPFFIWILFVHFKSVSQSVEDAAKIDGCSHFRVLQKIMMPIARPGIIAASVFAFMTSYNEFLFATVLSQTAFSRTASATISALAFSVGRYSITLIMAAAVFALMPPILIVIIFRKVILEGLISTFRR
jgi:multiple sugar transport system permease protein